MHNTKITQAVLNVLCTNKDVRCVAGWVSSKLYNSFSVQYLSNQLAGQFAYYFPKVYKYYTVNLQQLFGRHTYLTHNFDNSIFPAATFNMGPGTVSLRHADHSNYYAGSCHICSGDEYNHKHIEWNELEGSHNPVLVCITNLAILGATVKISDFPLQI